MTEQQAGEVISLLTAGFLNMTMESQSFEVWVKLMAELEDVEAAALTAIDYARFDDKFPSFADFRRSYLRKRESMTVEQQRPVAGELEAGPKLEAPGWVRMWAALRDANDLRAFPEQEQAYLRHGMTWPPEEGLVSGFELAAWVQKHPKGTPMPKVRVLKSI